MKEYPAYDRLHEILLQLLSLWLVEGDKGKAYEYFQSFSITERWVTLGALREVISTSTNAKFRQAAKDIPEYIASKL